ncbi:MarR family transcriptional regulator [Nocardia sp. NPDC004568]|uniref:MarR family transcriptional regulator n=1 Tax=Nocardia sp. NPDC004568 TaxID=3154551 RepID=UPI0033B642E0
MIDRLEQAGYVARTRDPADRRQASSRRQILVDRLREAAEEDEPRCAHRIRPAPWAEPDHHTDGSANCRSGSAVRVFRRNEPPFLHQAPLCSCGGPPIHASTRVRNPLSVLLTSPLITRLRMKPGSGKLWWMVSW